MKKTNKMGMINDCYLKVSYLFQQFFKVESFLLVSDDQSQFLRMFVGPLLQQLPNRDTHQRFVTRSL